jgi:hypothetical protein
MYVEDVPGHTVDDAFGGG